MLSDGIVWRYELPTWACPGQLADLPRAVLDDGVPVWTGAMSWNVVCTVTRARPGVTGTATMRVLAARSLSLASVSRAS